MFNRKEVKEEGKLAFKANYWRSVLCALIIALIAGGSGIANGGRAANQNTDNTNNGVQDAFNSMTDEQKSMFAALAVGLISAGLVIFIVYTLLKIFVFNPLLVGSYGFFQDNTRGFSPDLGTLRTGFDNYKNHVLTMFLRDLFTALWFCVFVIPGFVKIYSYRMVPFILRDHPEMSGTEAITASRHLMNGNKWNTFVFDLSYIGWYLLGAVTFGLVNVFWTEPYRQNANAVLYQTLIGANGPTEGYYTYADGPYAGGPQGGAYAPDAPDAPVVPVTPLAPEAPIAPEAAPVAPETPIAPEVAPVVPEAPIEAEVVSIMPEVEAVPEDRID